MYSLRKPLQGYHLLNHMTMPLNSRTHSYPNEPRLTRLTPSNIKPARSSSKNTSRQRKSPPQNPLKQCPSSLSMGRKLVNYNPAKTTSTSIATQSTMSIPFPSSPTSLTNYEDRQFSSNSTYNGNITMSSSNLKTNGRLPSPPH